MIPYEQLVAALTSWRQRNGMPTTESTGRAAGGADGGYGEAAYGAASYGAASYAEGGVVEMADDDAIVEVSGHAEHDERPASASEYAAVETFDEEMLDPVDEPVDDDQR